MNDATKQKLQLDEVKELVKGHCASSLGKQLIDQLQPSGQMKVVKRRLAENIEAKKLLDYSSHIPLEGLSDINILMEKVEKGMILDPHELISITDFLRGSRKIKSFMADKELYAATLSSYAGNITACEDIENEIEAAIKNYKVDAQASKELKKIRRNIDTTEGIIKERLSKFLTASGNKSYIQEFVISKRKDRFVIPIKASFKNEVEGTILDVSAKGQTVFLEPKSVAKFSSDLISLQSEETIEEYKILANLTELIFERIAEIKLNIEIMAEYDLVFAKAKYSQSIRGITPQINSRGYIKIVGAKHPLFPGEVVPLNLEIGEGYRTLLITGPNAGGKTVALKTVGLLTLMVQCGFDICADERTIINVFVNIFADIGDDQSISNALSTFSSHIKNIAGMMDSANNSTLMLFDEIGSGTEPNEGAALAISVLEECYRMGCITIASTHYGEIEQYAALHPDFENAGMIFDKETLQPLYKLTIGISQDSNALFIARKMGIKERVLTKARGYMDGEAYSYDPVNPSKIKIGDIEEEAEKEIEISSYNKGDKVKLLEEDDYAIIHKPINEFNNVEVLYKDQLIEVNVKRIEPYLTAKELYPEGYDLDTLFISFRERKLDWDIARGSKKALKQIQKEIKQKGKS